MLTSIKFLHFQYLELHKRKLGRKQLWQETVLQCYDTKKIKTPARIQSSRLLQYNCLMLSLCRAALEEMKTHWKRLSKTMCVFCVLWKPTVLVDSASLMCFVQSRDCQHSQHLPPLILFLSSSGRVTGGSALAHPAHCASLLPGYVWSQGKLQTRSSLCIRTLRKTNKFECNCVGYFVISFSTLYFPEKYEVGELVNILD